MFASEGCCPGQWLFEYMRRRGEQERWPGREERGGEGEVGEGERYGVVVVVCMSVRVRASADYPPYERRAAAVVIRFNAVSTRSVWFGAVRSAAATGVPCTCSGEV